MYDKLTLRDYETLSGKQFDYLGRGQEPLSRSSIAYFSSTSKHLSSIDVTASLDKSIVQ